MGNDARILRRNICVSKIVLVVVLVLEGFGLVRAASLAALLTGKRIPRVRH
jgi:hypothetical protein